MIREKLVDFIAMDIKGPLSKYKSIMGWPVPPAKIRRSIGLVIDSGLDHEFRTTVVKGLLEVADFDAVGKLVKGARRFALQHFRAIPEMVKTEEFASAETFSDEEFAAARQIMERYVESVVIH